MVIEVVKELEAAKAKVLELEQSLEKELTQKLARLPYEYGFDDLASFIKALKAAAGARPGRRGAAKKAAGKPGRKAAGKRGKRARITPEVKARVKELVSLNPRSSAMLVTDTFGRDSMTLARSMRRLM